jgi:hypothetical protein
VQGGSPVKEDLVVMENLFYGRRIETTFDLKGSLRNRLVRRPDPPQAAAGPNGAGGSGGGASSNASAATAPSVPGTGATAAGNGAAATGTGGAGGSSSAQGPLGSASGADAAGGGGGDAAGSASGALANNSGNSGNSGNTSAAVAGGAGTTGAGAAAGSAAGGGGGGGGTGGAGGGDGGHARVAPPAAKAPVLQDQNLIDEYETSPLVVSEYHKRLLTMAVWNDTLLLSGQAVMDYSLLVGIEERNADGTGGEIVVGIIDYIRRFTWDKQVESWVKSGITGKGKNPTVISPDQYKNRFRAAMQSYFLLIPDKFIGKAAVVGDVGARAQQGQGQGQQQHLHQQQQGSGQGSGQGQLQHSSTSQQTKHEQHEQQAQKQREVASHQADLASFAPPMNSEMMSI